MSSSERQASRRRALAAFAALALAGCGFHLRGEATFHFQTIFVNAPAAPAFAVELRRAIEASGGAKLAETAAAADVVLDIATVADDKSVLSLSSGGRVAEYALAKRVVYSLRDKGGGEWMASREIVVRRTYLYDDTERLAREIQEGRLLKEMQSDAIAQIIRQLQVAKPPA